MNVVDPPPERGSETRLQKKMRLLRQNWEEMDSEMYAKESTSKQYKRLMNPIKDSIMKEAQESDPFCQSIRQLMKEKKTKSERYLLVNGIIHKIIVHEGIIHSPILVPESLQKWCLIGPSLAAGTCWTKTSVWIPEKKILLEKHGHTDVQSIVASCGLCKKKL